MDEDSKTMLARIDERTLHMKTAQDAHIKETNRILLDHEHRIRKNTTFRNWLAGVLAVAGTGLGATVSKIFGGQ